MLIYKYMVHDQIAVGRYTAILTETDRERIAGETDDPAEKRYEAISRVRKRIEELKTDTEILEEHHPKLLTELRKVVCEEDEE